MLWIRFYQQLEFTSYKNLISMLICLYVTIESLEEQFN